MRRTWRRFQPATVLLLLLTCTKQPPAPANEPVRAPVRAPIATDRTAYTMRNGELTVVTTFTAPASHPVYVTHCNGAQPMGLQRQVGVDWVNAWVAAIDACFSPPIEVRPGASHTAPLMIRRGAGAVTYPRGNETIESGTYRVVWFGVLRSYDPGKPPLTDELPEELRVSAPFAIEVPPHFASIPSQPAAEPELDRFGDFLPRRPGMRRA